MPHGLPDPISGSRQHFEDDVVLDAGLTLVVDAVGERKRVLDLGCGSGRLARALALRECDVVGFDSNPVAVEEARKYCTHAGVADLDAVPLDELLGEDRFDVIVVADVLQHLRTPIGLLDRARSLLLEGGYLVALVPNAAYGANRLTAIDGSADPADGERDGTRAGFTAKSLDELFLNAGYRIEPLQRTQRAIFDDANALSVDPSDFDPALLAEIERQPEAQTLQFVVRAQPLSNDARNRAISKRFIAANTQLSTAASRLQKRDREIERLSELAAEREASLSQMRTQLDESEAEVRLARSSLAALKDAARSGASSIARAGEFEARALAAEARYRELEAKAGELLERAHRAELEAARYGERLAVYNESGIAQRVADPDGALATRLAEAEAQTAQLRSSLDAEREALAAKLADAQNEFGTVLTTLRRTAEETEYGYAVRVADLEAERDALKTRVDEGAVAAADAARQIDADRAAHQSRLHQLGTEIQGLQEVIVTARARIGTLDARVDLLQSRYDEANAERDELRVERDAGTSALDALSRERDSLKAHVDRAQLDLEGIRANLKVVVGQRDELRIERDAEKAELDVVRARLQQSTASLDMLAQERDSLKAHVEKTQLDLEGIRGNLEIVVGQRDDLRVERDAESAALDATRARLEDATAALDALTQEHEALEASVADERRSHERSLLAARADFATIEGERTRLKDELVAMRERFAKAHDDFATIEIERNSLKTALFASRDALDDARAQAGEFRALFDLASAELTVAERDRAGYMDLLAVADAEIAAFGPQLAELQAAQREAARTAAADLAVLDRKLEVAAAAEAALIERVETLHSAETRAVAFEARAAELEQRLAIVERQRNQLQTERDDLKELQQSLQAQIQSGVEMWKSAIEAANERRTELDQALKASRKENAALRLRVDEAAKRTVALERRFADYVRGAIDQTRAETERTALLIDTVQGSVFWKLKRWLSFRR